MKALSFRYKINSSIAVRLYRWNLRNQGNASQSIHRAVHGDLKPIKEFVVTTKHNVNPLTKKT